MSKGLKSCMIAISALLVLGIIVTQFAQPRNGYEEIVMDDQALAKELNEEAQKYLENYFNITLSEQDHWEEQLILNQAKDGKLPNMLSYSAQNKDENLAEGSISFYGMIIEEESKRLRGMMYQCKTDAPVVKLTDEEVKQKAQDFLIQKGLVAADTTFEVQSIRTDEAESEFCMLTLTAGKDTYAIGYSFQWQQVMYFECVPGAPND